VLDVSEPLPENLLEHVAERLRVLGDARRLAILRLLLADGELNVGEIVERLHTGQTNVSKHLRVLQAAGVVARRPVGTAAYYQVTDPSLTPLFDLVCSRLREQVAAEAREFATA
jgi:DNA-binding transcriptional ArsR family regulator